MARPKSIKTQQDNNVVDVAEIPKHDGLCTYKVLHPVLGYKVGETFRASAFSVRFQVKHKSIVEIK